MVFEKNTGPAKFQRVPGRNWAGRSERIFESGINNNGG